MHERKPVIFVCCGQAADAEKQLGHSVVRLVGELTPYEGYFAENQSNLSGLTDNVFREINQAAGLIAVMHPRGEVRRDIVGEPSLVRASIWIEQEIAIAAFREHVLKRPLSVLAFIHKSIAREGAREVLMLNPVLFDRDDEVLEALRKRLPTWRPVAEAEFPIGMEFDWRRTSTAPGGERHDYQLVLKLTNRTNEPICDFLLYLRFPALLLESLVSYKHFRQPEMEPADSSYVVLRVTPENQGSKVLYPKQPTRIVSVQYFMNNDIYNRYHDQVLDLEVTATLYTAGREDIQSRRVGQITNF